MKKTILIIVALAALLIIGYGSYRASSNAPQANTYKIGVVATLTDSGANLGVPWTNGMKMAADEINAAGGINGKKLELSIQDAKIEPASSLNAVNYLLNVSKPDVYEVLFQVSANTITSILRQNKKPLISEAFGRSIVDENPYAFKGNFDALTGCEDMARYLNENNKYTKLGVLMSKVEYNDLCLRGIQKIVPDVSVYRYVYGDTDFRTFLTKANNDGVDMLATIGIDPEYTLMFKQIGELGYHIKLACATASECITPDVAGKVPANVIDGTIGIDFIPPKIQDTEFGKKYASLHANPGGVDYVYAAIGYESTYYIGKAMKECAPSDPACLVNALGKVEGYKTILGSKGFLDRVLQLNYRMYEWKNGEWNVISD